MHRVIKFNKKPWLKPYNDIKTELGKTAKNDFEKDFFKVVNKTFFGKTMEYVRKYRDTKLVTAEVKTKLS